MKKSKRKDNVFQNKMKKEIFVREEKNLSNNLMDKLDFPFRKAHKTEKKEIPNESFLLNRTSNFTETNNIFNEIPKTSYKKKDKDSYKVRNPQKMIKYNYQNSLQEFITTGNSVNNIMNPKLQIFAQTIMNHQKRPNVKKEKSNIKELNKTIKSNKRIQAKNRRTSSLFNSIPSIIVTQENNYKSQFQNSFNSKELKVDFSDQGLLDRYKKQTNKLKELSFLLESLRRKMINKQNEKVHDEEVIQKAKYIPVERFTINTSKQSEAFISNSDYIKVKKLLNKDKIFEEKSSKIFNSIEDFQNRKMKKIKRKINKTISKNRINYDAIIHLLKTKSKIK